MKNRLNQLFALHFFNDGFLASIILLLPFIKQSLHLSLTQIGILTSILSISGIILALPAGYFGHKIGAIKILSFAILLYSIGFITVGLSFSFFYLVMSFIIAAFGFGIFHPIAFSLVAKWSPLEKLGKAMGDFTAIGDIGRIAISSIVPFIIVAIGWNRTSIIYGIISLFSIFLIASLNKRGGQIETKKNDLKISYYQIIKNSKFIFALLITFFDNLASSALFIFIPFLFLQRNVNPSILGIFTSAFLIGNLIGKTTLGRLADKYTSAKIFIIAEFFMAVFIVLLTLSYSQFFIIIVSVILGALTAGTIPVRSTMITESTQHHKEYEKVFGIGSFVANIATSLAPIILGSVADKFGIVNAFYISAMFAIFAIIPAFFYKKMRLLFNSSIQ
ncbi:MAG: major facilitator superfamily MFS_1 [uncultured bacterium]|nr:MAG: major facilitator superfamily MFS_1 [uncultured bacterium]